MRGDVLSQEVDSELGKLKVDASPDLVGVLQTRETMVHESDHASVVRSYKDAVFVSCWGVEQSMVDDHTQSDLDRGRLCPLDAETTPISDSGSRGTLPGRPKTAYYDANAVGAGISPPIYIDGHLVR